MGKRGESAYPEVDGEEVVDVPAQACVGRAGTLGKTFSGYINLRTGEMRFDCAEELPFYLIVNLSKVPAMAAQPLAPVGLAAVERLEAQGEEQGEERENKRARVESQIGTL